ncbi:hypothetical protein PHYBLDRAFT_72955 [Phycomyces blakesleeanus NRRL 1555(-)]|uniref:Uncharacterized protein n=1 Tax=Phycomyces blakesleeanus (strain ATCC 8743b / DSM 1359 / FGSC 10004 / NBRC 33097 / NRRL 1555) TaxID=763407 RepID=A0A163ERU4_PHYB8|nr:hypothetical protein PHYBLDRAFT_72955 [Phycomyces blakesleeanus NRRL 1555(-)]OAD81130.1 hypothetical protein PHYBLDRAFT_72955 [Phycomyces blakesleeanus NRRL 1555(-)]|eukprot:XP_018299170.1 hypothetical protein PHYBLDRAFT_72955 [Phycomyces blakesleeanus NRRL 1555(-)]
MEIQTDQIFKLISKLREGEDVVKEEGGVEECNLVISQLMKLFIIRNPGYKILFGLLKEEYGCRKQDAVTAKSNRIRKCDTDNIKLNIVRDTYYSGSHYQLIK